MSGLVVQQLLSIFDLAWPTPSLFQRFRKYWTHQVPPLFCIVDCRTLFTVLKQGGSQIRTATWQKYWRVLGARHWRQDAQKTLHCSCRGVTLNSNKFTESQTRWKKHLNVGSNFELFCFVLFVCFFHISNEIQFVRRKILLWELQFQFLFRRSDSHGSVCLWKSLLTRKAQFKSQAFSCNLSNMIWISGFSGVFVNQDQNIWIEIWCLPFGWNFFWQSRRKMLRFSMVKRIWPV